MYHPPGGGHIWPPLAVSVVQLVAVAAHVSLGLLPSSSPRPTSWHPRPRHRVRKRSRGRQPPVAYEHTSAEPRSPAPHRGINFLAPSVSDSNIALFTTHLCTFTPTTARYGFGMHNPPVSGHVRPPPVGRLRHLLLATLVQVALGGGRGNGLPAVVVKSSTASKAPPPPFA